MEKLVIDCLICLLIMSGFLATITAVILTPVIRIAKWMIVVFVSLDGNRKDGIPYTND